MLFWPILALRTCLVSFADARGTRHGVEVQAESLFEAAVLALQILKKDGWTEPIGSATRLDAEVREPVTKHTVTVLAVERWLSGASPSPNERVKKDRLRAMLR